MLGLCCFSFASRPIKQWQKCLGGSQQDIPAEIIRTNDGNLILLSNIDSHDGDINFNHGSTDIWLSKIDNTGNILWQRSIGGSSIDIATGISELSNGNFMICGYTSSSDGDIPTSYGNFDMLLIYTDSIGEVIWSKVYGGSMVDLCYSGKPTQDGGFLLTGGSYSNDGDICTNYGAQDFCLIKTDCNGNIVWQKSSGGVDNDVCYDYAEDSHGNIYACGTSKSSIGNPAITQGNYDLNVIKYNKFGDLIWTKSFGGSDYETAQTIIIDSHQNILIGGYTRSINGNISANYGFGDSWILRINPAGNLVNEKTFGGSGGDNLYSIIETIDGGYLFTSATSSTDHDVQNRFGLEDIWLYKTDGSFNVEWSYSYGGSGNDRPVTVLENPDGGFLITGYTFSNNGDVSGQHGTSDIWLINLGCISPNAHFTIPAQGCMGDTIQFYDSSPYATERMWYLNNLPYGTSDSGMFVLSTPGTYNLSLNQKVCNLSSDYNLNIEVVNCNLPYASFAAQTTNVCANSELEFIDASSGATDWQWTFPGGNPATSNVQNPVVSYSTPGTYSVTLTASNSHGSQTSMRYNFITINPLPQQPVITMHGNELVCSSAYKYQWFYNEMEIGSAVSQNYFAILTGYYHVEVEDINGCKSRSDSVYYSMTSVEKNLSQHDALSIYPNPAIHEIRLYVKRNTAGTLRIINMNGQRMLERRIAKHEEYFVVDASNFADGIYNVLFTNDADQFTQQVRVTVLN
jgi:PKD repeat protein